MQQQNVRTTLSKWGSGPFIEDCGPYIESWSAQVAGSGPPHSVPGVFGVAGVHRFLDPRCFNGPGAIHKHKGIRDTV